MSPSVNTKILIPGINGISISSSSIFRAWDNVHPYWESPTSDNSFPKGAYFQGKLLEHDAPRDAEINFSRFSIADVQFYCSVED